MEKILNLNTLIEKIDFLIFIYDAIRIVDPIRKKVYYFFSKEKEYIEEENSCYEFWNQNKMCSNCVSMRAYTQNETFVKIEYNGDNVKIL